MSEQLDLIDPYRVPVKTPMFVGAGIVKTREKINIYSSIEEIDTVIYGSYSEQPNPGSNPNGDKTDFFYDFRSREAFNAISLKNQGWEEAKPAVREGIKRSHAIDQLAFIGVTAVGGEDPSEVIPRLVERAVETGADGVEINGSCRNLGYTSLLCHNLEQSLEIIAKCRELVGKEPYLIFKVSDLSPEAIDDYKEGELDVNAIDTINATGPFRPTKPNGDIRIEVNNGYAARSGPAIKGLARQNLDNWLKPHPKKTFEVWSIGGIDNGNEIFDRVHNLGATKAGLAQAFYRANKRPQRLAKRLANQYEEALWIENFPRAS